MLPVRCPPELFLVATLDPLLDPAPTTQSAPTQQSQSPETKPNLLLGILRRWPWLLLGLTTGIILGLLYHMQRAPVYQSSGQLLVMKNRPELIAGGSGDARTQYVEDYVGPQVILLKSETILKLVAEKRLDEQKPFRSPPPESVAARIVFLKKSFDVVREKEPGSNAPSNVLLLTFKASEPGDAPKYLRAIIAAYRDELSGVSEGASTGQLARLDDEIMQLKKVLSDSAVEIKDMEHKLRGEIDPTGIMDRPGLSQEELTSIRLRIAANRAAETSLKLRQIVVNGELMDIDAAGKGRAQRFALMAKYGIQSDRPSIFGDLRDPDSMLAHLRYKQSELSVRLGPGHPDMVALNKQIKTLEEEIDKRGGSPEDELERYRRKLDNENSAIALQLKVLDKQIAEDEEKARLMAPLQSEIENAQLARTRDIGLLHDAEREKTRVSGNRSTSVFELKDITRPGDGVQVAPVLLQSLFLGALVGMLLGSGLALRAELADRSFRSPADIRRQLGLAVLGHVPLIRVSEPAETQSEAKLDPVLAVYLRPRSAEAEAIRGIRTQLLFSTNNSAHQLIQITSPTAGDGKSMLSANLSIALAKSNKRVVLVDCDFRKPRVHKMFDLPNPDVGLASVVAEQADLGAAIQTCEIDNLSLLPCGPRPSNPAELLSSIKFQEVLDDLRANYDYVILDTPPILAVSDPAAVAPRADGVIVVFRMNANARPAAERAKEELMAVSARILGVVVNGSTERDMGYGYGYGYRYDYQYTDSYSDPKQ
jgi:polysaccharide biosynthesis transport protein